MLDRLAPGGAFLHTRPATERPLLPRRYLWIAASLVLPIALTVISLMRASTHPGVVVEEQPVTPPTRMNVEEALAAEARRAAADAGQEVRSADGGVPDALRQGVPSTPLPEGTLLKASRPGRDKPAPPPNTP